MEFIFGKEEYLVDQEVKKILKAFPNRPNIHDETSSIAMMIMDIKTISMFAKEKIIIIKDHPIFSNNEEGKKFLREFKNVNLGGVNLLFVLTDKCDSSNAFVSYLLNNAIKKAVKPIKQRDIPQIIRDVVAQNGGEISSSAVIRMMQKFPLNLRLIINETKKLLIENKNITEKQVEQSIDSYFSEDFFALSNSIVNNDKSGIIKFYNEKIVYGQKPIAIIGQIAATLNLSILVDSYKKQGLRLKEVADELKIHIFRIKKANELLASQSSEKIENLIKRLADLEFDIKVGKIDNAKGLDRFILELIR